MNNPSGHAAGGAEPGELMRLVADGLIASGFDVRLPECPDGCRLTIACQEARCALSVSDWGGVEWACLPRAGSLVDPKRVADLATMLLTGQVRDYPRQGNGYGRDGVTFKGVVGLELKARGFAVDLEVYQDVAYFDARAEIVVTNTSTGEDSHIHVADDGGIVWMRDYWAQAGTIVWEPGYRAWIADPVALAGSVVATVTRAMAQVAPVGR